MIINARINASFKNNFLIKELMFRKILSLTKIKTISIQKKNMFILIR